MTTTGTTIPFEQDVPLEVPLEEYQDLLLQADELVSSCTTDQEHFAVVQEEWLQAARYGDVDVLRALWQIHSSILLSSSSSLIDSNGNTALHLSSANGHESVVKLLLLLFSMPSDDGTTAASAATTMTTTTANSSSSSPSSSSFNIRMVTNHSGNTPLHWAAANGHDKILHLLMYFHNGSKPKNSEETNAADTHKIEQMTDMETTESSTAITPSPLLPPFVIDVLQKNHFGRSILTEGFTSQNENVVQLLLEHESASEERFLDSTSDDVGAKQHATAANGDDRMDVDNDDDDGNDNDDLEEDDDNADEDPTNLMSAAMTALEKDAIIHDFDMLSVSSYGNTAPPSSDISSNPNKMPLRVRELPMTGENPLGDTAIEDVTGYGIWCASLILARWMADLVSTNNNKSNGSSNLWKDRSVVELGAGCGVPGLVVACHSPARYVLLTDLNPITVQNLQYNITLNTPPTLTESTSWFHRVQASTIDWLDRKTWPQPPTPLQQQKQMSPQPQDRFDVVLGSDLIYQASAAPMLRNVIAGLLRPSGTFYYVAPSTTGRDGLSEFIELLQQPLEMSGDDNNQDITSRFELVAANPAPKHYHDNPLCSQDDDDFFLHFHEMSSSQYILYEFVKL